MIKLLTIKEIKNSLKNIRRKHIIQTTGLSRSTVNNFCEGKNKNYKIQTLIKITHYINDLQKKNEFFNN